MNLIWRKAAPGLYYLWSGKETVGKVWRAAPKAPWSGAYDDMATRIYRTARTTPAGMIEMMESAIFHARPAATFSREGF